MTEQRLRNLVAAAAKRLFPAGTAGLIAVSGGRDSVSLAHLLGRLNARFKWRLTLVYIDHGIRASAHREVQLVRRLGREWGFPVVIRQVAVPTWARRWRIGLEAAGRELRYQALACVAGEQRAQWVATGHTLDDQAETVLMNLIRGTGFTGLAGMPSKRPLGSHLWLGRPLLEVERSALATYIKRHHLPFLEDPTNRQQRFLRNRLRHELLPLLERYNPRIKIHLATLAHIIQVEEESWASLIHRLLAKTVRRYGKNVSLDLSRFFRYDKPLGYRLLRAVTGPFPFRVVAQLYEWAVSGTSTGRLSLPGGWKASKVGGRLILSGSSSARLHKGRQEWQDAGFPNS